MKRFPRTINRNGDEYEKLHYRAHWQPLWAILGLVLCVLLIITQGWAAIYDLRAQSPGVSKEDSIVDLVAAYLGVSRPFPASVYVRDMEHAKIRTSQLYSSEYTSFIRSCTRQRSDRMFRSRTSGIRTMCPMNLTSVMRDGKAKVAYGAF